MNNSRSVSSFVRHLTRPVRGGAAGVLLVFAVLLFLSSEAGIAGIPLGLILTSWFFKYAYILFDHTARGFDDPPTLDISMLNPLDEQRPLAQLALLGLLYLGVTYVNRCMGAAPAAMLTAVALLVLPASVAILGLEGNVFKAAYPVAWVRMILGLGPLYVLVLLVIAVYTLLIWILARWELWLPVETAIFMFCVLSVFSALGGALYERRDELGLETWASPERAQDRRDKEDLRLSQSEVTHAYGLARAGSHVEAWQSLQNWLTRRGFAPDDYRWLCDRVVAWDDPRYITRLSEDYVDRLLILKRSGEALDVVAARLDQDPAFRPKSAASTLQIARIAAAGGGKPRVARTLLTDFPTRFAGDPSIVAADALARELSS